MIERNARKMDEQCASRRSRWRRIDVDREPFRNRGKPRIKALLPRNVNCSWFRAYTREPIGLHTAFEKGEKRVEAAVGAIGNKVAGPIRRWCKVSSRGLCGVDLAGGDGEWSTIGGDEFRGAVENGLPRRSGRHATAGIGADSNKQLHADMKELGEFLCLLLRDGSFSGEDLRYAALRANYGPKVFGG